MSTAGMPHQAARMATASRAARAVGEQGEQLACEHLEARGWEVLDRNWRCPQGELDIVARDGGWVVFCEVKTRRSQRFGSPAEAVTPVKAARLRRLAGVWLRAHDVPAGQIRIDVVGVLLRPAAPPELVHLEGVA
ncbi:YraN family protein [Ornithinimicrobium sediminis]|uniref:YraN family protein n=1 Tax=Ornithinimicrobium sediminis TaxID=2904603 RepID=UPI001E5190E6|nr:YraN family protein [Ornithinimicrobium sediminis]MCE0486635.1 YraN family protein [Ornithinimicrobium sediminis]